MVEFVKRICYLRWRNKAVKRAKEIRRLNKKILELEESRDNWKKKAVELKENYRDARFALALMYSSQNDKDKAREEIEYILKYINPNDELVKNKLQEI